MKAIFSRSPKIFLSKKKKSGQKVLSGQVKYISVDPKEPKPISIKLDFKPNLGMGFFSERRK